MFCFPPISVPMSLFILYIGKHAYTCICNHMEVACVVVHVHMHMHKCSIVKHTNGMHECECWRICMGEEHKKSVTHAMIQSRCESV